MTDRKQKLLTPRIGLWGLFDAGFAVLVVVTTVSFLGRFSWLFELMSHFRVQYLVLLFFSAAVYALRRRFRGMAAALAIAALCLPALLDAYIPTGQIDAKGPVFKAMVMHVNPSDGKFHSALELIRSEKPTFVVMEDVTTEWEAIMRQELSAMPSARFICRQGMAFLSMRPWDRVENAGISSWGFPGLMISYSDPPLTIFAVHVPAPISAAWRQERARQFR